MEKANHMPSSRCSSRRPRHGQLVLLSLILIALAGTARAWEWPKISDFKLPSAEDIKQGIKNTMHVPNADSIKAGLDGMKAGVQSAVDASVSHAESIKAGLNGIKEGVQSAVHSSVPSAESIKAQLDGIKAVVQSAVDASVSRAESIQAGLDGIKEGVQDAMHFPDADSIKERFNAARSALTDLAKRGAEYSKKIIMDGVVSIKALQGWVSSFRPYVPPSPGVSDTMRAALIAHGFEPRDVNASFGLSTWWRGRDNAIAIVIGGVPSWEEKKRRAAAGTTSTSATDSGSGATESPSSSASVSDSGSASASASASATDTSANADPLGELTLVMRVVASYGEGLGLAAERLNANATMTSLGVWNKTSVAIMGFSLGPALKLGLFATASVTPEQATTANGDREGYRVKVALTFHANAKVLSDAVKRGLKLAGSGLADLTKFSAKLYEFELFFPAVGGASSPRAALPKADTLVQTSAETPVNMPAQTPVNAPEHNSANAGRPHEEL